MLYSTYLVYIHASIYCTCLYSIVYRSLHPTIFSTLLHNCNDFFGGGGGGLTEHKMRVFIFSPAFIWNISHSKKNSARYCNKYTYIVIVQYPLYFSDFSENWIFSIYFCKLLWYQISWKSVHWELSCCSMRTDILTDRNDEGNRHFSQFCERA
jgi:hypothetical protein